MKRFIWCGVGVLVGYVLGALLGGGLIATVSSDPQVITIGELVAGPIGAIAGAVIGWVATEAAKARSSFDGRKKR